MRFPLSFAQCEAIVVVLVAVALYAIGWITWSAEAKYDEPATTVAASRSQAPK